MALQMRSAPHQAPVPEETTLRIVRSRRSARGFCASLMPREHPRKWLGPLASTVWDQMRDCLARSNQP
eukprot:9085790-Pyramimonas_sp.AAC.1